MGDHGELEPEDDGFVTAQNFPATLTTLLKEVGRIYVPVMLANADAVDRRLS